MLLGILDPRIRIAQGRVEASARLRSDGTPLADSNAARTKLSRVLL